MKQPVEQGKSQGCPHSGSFFIFGLANLEDSLPNEIMVNICGFLNTDTATELPTK